MAAPSLPTTSGASLLAAQRKPRVRVSVVAAADQATYYAADVNMRPTIPGSSSMNGSLPPSTSAVPPPSRPPPPPPVRKNYTVSMWDAMAFNGPAPELVNSRLAMLGFVAGAVGEARSGETLLAQAAHVHPLALLALAGVVYGSMVPILKGARNEPFGPFTPAAERLNGRAAMLALACLAALEWKSGVCFF